MKYLKIILALLLMNTLLHASEEVPTQEEIAKLYVATFNRAPDSAGLDYWTNGSGLKLSQIAQSFFDQPETQTLYPPQTSNRNFIKSVYMNLFNREPDQAGWDYWENELNTGAFSKNRFIEAVINGAQDSEVSLDKTILSNKTTVGLHFADAGLEDTNAAKTVMEGITADTDTVDFILVKIDASEIGQDVWDNFGEPTCIQVITYAIDPATKQCKAFPTPCDVPEGWSGCVMDTAVISNTISTPPAVPAI